MHTPLCKQKVYTDAKHACKPLAFLMKLNDWESDVNNIGNQWAATG